MILIVIQHQIIELMVQGQLHIQLCAIQSFIEHHLQVYSLCLISVIIIHLTDNIDRYCLLSISSYFVNLFKLVYQITIFNVQYKFVLETLLIILYNPKYDNYSLSIF